MKILLFSTHQNLEISEIRAKIKGKLLKTSNIKQKFRLRRAKSVKNNLNTSISIQKNRRPKAAIFFDVKIPKSRIPVGQAPFLWVPRGRRAVLWVPQRLKILWCVLPINKHSLYSSQCGKKFSHPIFMRQHAMRLHPKEYRYGIVESEPFEFLGSKTMRTSLPTRSPGVVRIPPPRAHSAWAWLSPQPAGSDARPCAAHARRSELGALGVGTAWRGFTAAQ